MHTLADQERFEEAAITRDRVAALTGCCADARRSPGSPSSGRMSVAVEDGVVTFVDGRLLLGDPELELRGAARRPADAPRRPIPAHLDRRRADELLVVARWLDREVGAGRARLLEASGAPSSPRGGALPRYEPSPRRGIRRGR